jgi:hypothetical protein
MSETGDATASAVLEEAEARDFGTSSEDVEAYAAAGGAVAGAAACAAVGAAAAAPLCATIGGWAAEFIAGTVVEWCTSDAEAERARRRRQEVRQLHNRIVQIEAWDTLNGAMLTERVEALRELHSELWPDEDWVEASPDVAPQQREVYPAIVLLARYGMPTEPRERGGYLALGTPSLIVRWEELRREMSDETLFEMLQADAIEISEAIERAYDRAVIQLAAEAAGDGAEARARRPNIRQVSPPTRVTVFGATAGVEPVGPGRVRVPRYAQSWKSAGMRLGGVLAACGVWCGVSAWRARA